jgi:hypothetical protein
VTNTVSVVDFTVATHREIIQQETPRVLPAEYTVTDCKLWTLDRLSLQSSELGPPPHPVTRRRVCPLLWFLGGLTYSFSREGAGGADSDEGTDTPLLQVFF